MNKHNLAYSPVIYNITMASPSGLSSQVNVGKLISDMKDCVQELSTDFTNSNIPIDDDSVVCQRFCSKLEQFLLLGFTERSSLFGRKKGYWDFFKTCLTSSRRGGVELGVKFANNNPEVRTSAGRGRAFIRYCLAHGCLGDALQQSLMSTEALNSFYAMSAPMKDPDQSQELLVLVYELADVNFDLAPGGHDLDSGWPTFARRQFSSPGLSWKPLSRSTSIASFSSSFNSSFLQDPSSPPPPGSMGAMESLPENQQTSDLWWGENATNRNTQDVEVQTESTSNSVTNSSEVSALIERLQIMQLDHDEHISSLVTKYETDIQALSEQLLANKHENKILQSQSQTIQLSIQNSEIAYDENSQKQNTEINNLKEKLAHFENECKRLEIEAKEKQHAIHANVEAGSTELRHRLSESELENEELREKLEELRAKEGSSGENQTYEIASLKLKLEESAGECRRLKEEIADSQELKSQLVEAQADIDRLTTQLRTEETRWAAELDQRMQQAKWEMTSLQKHVDNLLVENGQLRNDLTQISITVNESRDKFTTNELYVEKLTDQVTALKDVVSIGKQMLGMRDAEMEQLHRKLQNLEDMLETEREKNTVLSNAFSPEAMGNANIKKEYETQLENIKSLKEIYSQRVELMTDENQALKDTLVDKNRQISLMDKRFAELDSQYNNLRESTKGKEGIVLELQTRICNLTEECRSLTNQLTMISNLFTELGKSEVDLEKLRSLQDAMAEGLADSENSTTNLSKVWCSLSELLENSSGDTPTPVEGSEGCYKSVNTPYGPRLVISVSQTFLRLKDLILEKKSLQKELGQLRNLNTHLETKLQQQETRLSLVLQELKKTWGVVNKMRSQHSQLRTSEAILRYDLQQKRKIVNELKEELEYCKEIWQQAREKTTESEEQYRTLKDEFASRRRRPLLADDSTEMNSAESGYSDGRGDDDSATSSTSDGEENTGDMTGSEQEPSSDSHSPDILPDNSTIPAFTDSIDTEAERSISPTPSSSSAITVESMPQSTGAIRKIPKIIDTPNNTQDNVVTAVPEISVPEIKETSKITQDPPPKVDVEEILDARAERLKRLEEQCSQLFKRVVRTSNMSVAISNRLEELHEHYGDNEENRESAKRRSLRSSESDNSSSQEIPKPPPMPTDIPNTRLHSELESITAEVDNVLQNTNLDFRIPTPPPVVSAEFSTRSSDRVRRRVPNILPEETINRTTTHDNDCIANVASGNQDLEVTTEKSELTNTLAKEQEQKAALEEQLSELRQKLTNQSQDLQVLRRDLTKQKAELHEQTEGREETQTLLHEKQGECSSLRLEIEQLSGLEAKLRKQLGEQQEVAGSRLLELQSLQGDITQLHESIIRLTKQKDSLFKECYALKQANRERGWQPDHQVTQCSACGVSFSLLVRRHHCRLCGRIYCGACSSHWVAAHGDTSRRTRSCSECHTKHQIASTTGSETPAANRDSSSETSSLTSYQITAEGEDDSAGLAAGEDDDAEEEDFSVISEEEVVLSQCVPYSPNPEILQYWKSCEIQSGLTRTITSLLATGDKLSESVWVRAGVIYAVPLVLTADDCSPQVNVTWEFSTEPKCIAFSVLYKKDADIPTENSSILVPTTRVNSHLHPIRGRLRARREGLYTLMFDNSYSRFTGKKVNFSLTCESSNGSGRSSAGPESPQRGVSKSPSRDLDCLDPEIDLNDA